MSDVRKVNWKKILWVLFIEMFTVLVIVSIFKYVQSHLWAARWASMTFMLECVAILALLWPWKLKNWTFTLPSIFIFLGVFVLPMVVFRWTTTDDFMNLHWLGMSGPTLHTWSSKFYYVVFVAGVGDLIVAIYNRLPTHSN